MIWFCACDQWRSTVNFSAMTFQHLMGINDANFTSKMPLFFLLQTLTNAKLQTSVTRMLNVRTLKDLTTALVKEDLKATGELTARVRFLWRAYLIIKIRMQHFSLKKWRFHQRLNEFLWQHNNFHFHLFVIVCFIVFPSEAISFPHIDKLQIRAPFINWKNVFFSWGFLSAELRLQ